MDTRISFILAMTLAACADSEVGGTDAGARTDARTDVTLGDSRTDSMPASDAATDSTAATDAPDGVDAGDGRVDAGSMPDPAAAERRRAYLRYYAPIILKSADEGDSNHWGMDWITNFDFDRDGTFATNKRNWESVDSYVANPTNPAFASWQIRPTLYSAAIEFVDGGNDSMILLYHVYHAKEEGSVHDWERVEVRVNHVGAAPGSPGEDVAYVTITEHSSHQMRVPGVGNDLNFMTTSSGRHPLIWQAEWSAALTGFYRAELHFVETPWATLASELSSCPTCNAEVDVHGTSDQKDVHYFFVPDGDPEAVAVLNAQTLTAANASTLAARATSTYDWRDARRIRYELQDLADIMPTHADCASCGGVACVTENGWQTYPAHWGSSTVGIWLEDAIASETGTSLVPSSSACSQAVTFHRDSLDVEDPTDGAEGYPNKHWFWGAYHANGDGNAGLLFDGGGFLDPVTGAMQVRDCAGAMGQYWCQHDYYAHDGRIGSGDTEYGRWLPRGWHTAAMGGFDGRWVQLFAD